MVAKRASERIARALGDALITVLNVLLLLVVGLSVVVLMKRTQRSEHVELTSSWLPQPDAGTIRWRLLA